MYKVKRIIGVILCGVFIILVGFTNIDKNKLENQGKTVALTKINSKVWVHTTYENYNGSITPSNGLIVITTKGAVLIDTPWTNKQTEDLIKLIKKEFNKNIVLALTTHAHGDRIGGIDTLLKNKISTKSTKSTAILAEKYGYKKPEPVLKSNQYIVVGNTKFQVFYPGEGHTSDNITIWIPEYKLLFGGCLVKALQSKTLGNVEDANVLEWPISIKKVMDKYKDIKTVVPGHGDFGGQELLKHSLELFDQK